MLNIEENSLKLLIIKEGIYTKTLITVYSCHGGLIIRLGLSTTSTFCLMCLLGALILNSFILITQFETFTYSKETNKFSPSTTSKNTYLNMNNASYDFKDAIIDIDERKEIKIIELDITQEFTRKGEKNRGLDTYTSNKKKKTTFYSNVAQSFAYLTHNPINITGDADFLFQNASDPFCWTGTGTVEDPYIIEDLNITLSADAAFPCIQIQNLESLHLRIQNCWLDAYNTNNTGIS
ncbi:MAG: hypothetical protein ACFFDT_22335, partial [Candidatus Hodarchaeota archaeon]